MSDLIALRKWRHELKRAAKRFRTRYQEKLKSQTGKGPRKALQHSTKKAYANVRAGEYGAIKRLAWKRPGVPRAKS